jgi:hypothetical protein
MLVFQLTSAIAILQDKMKNEGAKRDRLLPSQYKNAIAIPNVVVNPYVFVSKVLSLNRKFLGINIPIDPTNGLTR